MSIPNKLNPFGISNKPYSRKLQYIQSTGTQVIKTDWFFPSNGVSWEIKAKLQCDEIQPVPWPVMFGSNNSNGGATNQYYKAQVRCTTIAGRNYADYTSGARFLVAAHDGTSPNIHAEIYYNDPAVDPIGIVTLDMKWENEVLTSTVNNITLSDASYINNRLNTPLYIFALCARASLTDPTLRVTNHSKMKLFYFQLFQDGNKVLDFIPVLDLNNVPCLYDKVSRTPFYNQGTGQFLYS